MFKDEKRALAEKEARQYAHEQAGQVAGGMAGGLSYNIKTTTSPLNGPSDPLRDRVDRAREGIVELNKSLAFIRFRLFGEREPEAGEAGPDQDQVCVSMHMQVVENLLSQARYQAASILDRL